MRAKRDMLLCSLIFLVSLTIFLNSGVIRVSDSKYTLLLSEQIITHGNLQLDGYFWRDQDSQNNGSISPKVKLPRHVHERKGHLYYIYPYGTSILSVPFALAYRALGKSVINSRGEYCFYTEKLLQKVIASVLMAAACVIFYIISRVLLPIYLSVFVTVVAGFGTQVWSTASTGLWSHTWDVVILSLSCLLLLRAEKEQKIQPIILATLLSWGFFVRPTAVLYILPFTFLVWIHFRSRFVPFLLTGLFWLLLFLLYSFVHEGELPHYFQRSPWSFSTLFTGLYAQLLSPTRGLLVYVPSILIVGYLLAANWKDLEFKILVNVSIIVLVLHAFVSASKPRTVTTANPIGNGGT